MLKNKINNLRRTARRKKGKLIKKRGSKCYYCQKKFPQNKLTIDHYIPLSKGGSNKRFNLRLACSKCNHDKGNLMPLDFYEKRAKVFKEKSDKE